MPRPAALAGRPAARVRRACSTSTMRSPRWSRARPSRRWRRSSSPGGASNSRGSIPRRRRPSRGCKPRAAELLPRGIKGEELAALEEGWATLLDESPDARLVEERGAALFGLGARLLGASARRADRPRAGLYAADGRQRGAACTISAARRNRRSERLAIPPSLRPLTGLASLGRRDSVRAGASEPEATPGAVVDPDPASADRATLT